MKYRAPNYEELLRAAREGKVFCQSYYSDGEFGHTIVDSHARPDPHRAHAPAKVTWCATCERDITAGEPRYCRRCNIGFDAQGVPVT